MPIKKIAAPRSYLGVMISSTFTDLASHREALIKAIDGQQLKAVAMENDSAKPAGDVLASSLNMVMDSAAYVGVISHKYGQVPKCPRRNPNDLSLTELEFNEARRLSRPILIFIMGEDHDVKRADVEQDADKARKLLAFRENVKLIGDGSSLHRVYKTFNNIQEFQVAATQSVAELRRHLEQLVSPPSIVSTEVLTSKHALPTKRDPIPSPPSLYAEPPYIGSHSFVGRMSQLETLNEWSSPDDSNPILLYEAIGGIGKSMLTWEWLTKYATGVRGDWAGLFWYSFYEKGATMADFCRRVLAYMTGHPKSFFREKNTAELAEPLLHQLRDRSWLLVLDGLERVLVSYHRLDAAQLQDEHAGITDKISHRDPCAAINPEDEDLLRALSAASPSKLLLTSRLVPRSLLNRSGQPIPGVLRERLPGLRPGDAELLIRSCGVSGTSQHIQAFLKTHCDCHPLVIGVLAGLITDYLPDKGNFDAWVADAKGGGSLNLAKLDLVQKRNHILSIALMALPEKGRQLLSTLALISESVDYPTLVALNPSLPPLPELVGQPKKPRKAVLNKLTYQERQDALEDYRKALLLQRAKLAEAIASRETEVQAAAPLLSDIVRDLERRGLLQYDHGEKHYDLHPVVRGIAAGGLRHEEKSHYGQRVVDHFSQQAHDPYEQAETLEDFDNARLIVKALFQMGRKSEARRFISGNNFVQVLNMRFEAHNEILSIVRPFFSEDWTEAPLVFDDTTGMGLANIAAMSLRRIRAFSEAFAVSETALLKSIENGSWPRFSSQLLSLSSTAGERNHLALEDRLMLLAVKASHLSQFNEGQRDSVSLARFRQLSKLGRFEEADVLWKLISKKELSGSASSIAWHHYAVHRFFRGSLTEDVLKRADILNRSVSALGVRNLIGLRGFWYLEAGNWDRAKQSLQEAVSLAHKAGKLDRRSEICLALTKAKLGEPGEPEQAAEHFSQNLEEHCVRSLAELWLAIGNREEAIRLAKSAFLWAWADGEPYSHWHEINKSRDLLQQLGVEVPVARPYDEDTVAILPIEQKASNAIKKLGMVRP
jgi:tetratricopeptide (TPR) repeat protein